MRKLSNKLQNFMANPVLVAPLGTTGQTTKGALGVCPADYPGGLHSGNVRVINGGTGTGTYTFKLYKRNSAGSDIQISEVSPALDADVDNAIVTFKGNGVGIEESDEIIIEDIVTGTISTGTDVMFSLSFYA